MINLYIKNLSITNNRNNTSKPVGGGEYESYQPDRKQERRKEAYNKLKTQNKFSYVCICIYDCKI